MSGMYSVYNDINPATLTGAIDVIVIEQSDGSFTCGPFHVRFGKMGALRPADKIIDIYLNGNFIPDLQMKLGSAGEAFFIEEVCEGEIINDDEKLTYSPTLSGSKTNESFQDTQLVRTRSLETFEDIIIVPRRKIRVRSGSSENFACSESEEDDNKDISLEKNYHNNDYAIECLSDSEENKTSDNQRLLAYKSDSALNQSHVKEEEALNITWDWGNFPESIATPNAKSKDDSNLKDFRNKSVSESDKMETSAEKKIDNSKGIYLEDLVTENVDKDVKSNYIYTRDRSLESTECHKSSSLDGLSSDGGYRSDGENSGLYSPPYPVVNDLKLSLCGGLNSEDSISMDHFIQHLVSYEDFLKSPDTILQDPNLVLSLNGKHYPWGVCGPMIVAMLSFQTQLPHQSLKRLQEQYLPKKKTSKVSKSWFPFGRQNASNNQNVDNKNVESKSSSPEAVKDDSDKKKEILPEIIIKAKDDSQDKIKTKTYRKKIRLSSDEIKRLNLKKGSNCIEYKMTTKFQGTTSCVAHIFNWNWKDLIVVSDVDGTITKSDVMGQLLPMIGRDWTQAGVARLYNKIAENEYRFVYLSARAIGQSGLTKRFLSDVVQEGVLKLPDGPVLLSPNSLLHAFHQEVIVKNPEKFKIQCMNDIKSLFPDQLHPLYSGFGNKPNDVKAYREVGIPDRRNFIVNPQGVVRNQLSQTYSTNYGDLSVLVDYFFPYYGEHTVRVQQDFFNDASFWREPLPEMDLP